MGNWLIVLKGMPPNSRVVRKDLDLQVELALDGIGLDVGGKRLVSFLVARRLHAAERITRHNGKPSLGRSHRGCSR